MGRSTWVLSVALLAATARADDPKMPPDIAAIVAKMKGGAMPTADDMAKLKAWQQGVIGRANAPVPPKPGAAADKGIPIRVTVHEEFTQTLPGGSDQGAIDGWADAQLFPALNGNGDYFAGILDPSLPASSFRIMPILEDGLVGRPDNGGGKASLFHKDGSGTITTHVKLSKCAFGAMIVTTGKGDGLLAQGTGFDAAVEGGTVTTDSSGAHSSDVKEDTLRMVQGPLGGSFPEENRHPQKTGQPTPTPSMKLSFAEFQKAVTASAPAIVKGTETFSWTDGDVKTTGTSTITIQVRPPPLELIVQPKLFADYKTWLPVPDAHDGGDAKLFGSPQPFDVRIALHDTANGPAKGEAPVPANSTLACALEVSLADVSTNDGVAMNYPQHQSGPAEDMFFPKTGQPAGVVVDPNGQKLHITSKVKELVVKVAVRDAGASGRVEARCAELSLASRDPRTNDPGLAMPMDDNHNHVGDAWEKKYNIDKRNLPPKWDEEPNSNFSAPGDGLSLFEEYRGVVDEDANGVEHHERLDPTQMKLFVWVDHAAPDAKLWHDGAVMYGAATGVQMHFIHDKNRLAERDHVIHWLDFNATPYGNKPQCAIPIRDEPKPPPAVAGDNGFTKPTPAAAGDEDTLRPATTEYVSISHANAVGQIALWSKWLAAPPSSIKNGARTDGIDLEAAHPDDPQKLLARLITWVTMHELGHATGGRHHFVHETVIGKDTKEELWGHGDTACPMRYWNLYHSKESSLPEMVRFLVGAWKLTEPNEGGSWKFCSVDRPNMRIKPD